jgi:C-terminal peptidase prc
MTIKKPIRFAHIIDDEKKVGYMHVDIFNNNLAKVFSVEYLKLWNAKQGMKSLILDLRGNPGGGIESAVAFCDLFLKSGLIVATVGNEEGVRRKEVLYMAKEGNEIPLVPLLIILDRESASAAELSASCLRDHKIAKIFGEKSYGKGEAQTTFPMYSKVIGDYGLKLTTSKFYSKTGFEKKPKISISGIGITPDYAFDFGFQDTMVSRYKNFKRAWGVWNQELAEHKTLKEAKQKSLYFMDLEKYDPGLKKAIEILSIAGEK